MVGYPQYYDAPNMISRLVRQWAADRQGRSWGVGAGSHDQRAVAVLGRLPGGLPIHGRVIPASAGFVDSLRSWVRRRLTGDGSNG